jgi:hypothetical protein
MYSIFYSIGLTVVSHAPVDQNGYWKVRVLQKHLRQMRPRQFVPPTFVTALLIALFVSFLSFIGKVFLVVVLGSYILANLFASIWIASKRGWRYVFLLPVVYTILHLRYGSGFLVGLMKFADRWGDRLGNVPEF